MLRPSHYKVQSYQPITFCGQMIFYLGNPFKYIWRYKEKGGIEDLEKAQTYLQLFYQDDTFTKRMLRKVTAWFFIPNRRKWETFSDSKPFTLIQTLALKLIYDLHVGCKYDAQFKHMLYHHIEYLKKYDKKAPTE